MQQSIDRGKYSEEYGRLWGTKRSIGPTKANIARSRADGGKHRKAVGEIPHDPSSAVTEIQFPGVRLSHAHVFDRFFFIEVNSLTLTCN